MPRRKKNFSRYVFIALIFFVFFLLLKWLFASCQDQVEVSKDKLLSFSIPGQIDFAGETVPLDLFYVREAWEKDFLLLLGQEYQSILYLKRSQKYFPFIEAEIKKLSLPDDLKYIAVAESGLLENAVSSAGALGIWQFMPGTARDRGLIVDKNIDERKNFEKSTIAALGYLQFLYDQFHNWTLATASYNAGHNRIKDSVEKQKVENYYSLYLNKETSRYLFRILAIKEIMQNPEKYGLFLSSRDYFSWPDYQAVSTGKIDALETWSRSQGSNLKLIKELNPWILGNELPEGNWSLKILKL